VLVLQGSVAIKLSYGGKFFILVRPMSHFFLITTLKEFKKSTNICQSYSENKSGPVFSDSQCNLPGVDHFQYVRIKCIDIHEPVGKICEGFDVVFDSVSCPQLTELCRA